jgi:hypothetical protein
MHLDQAFLVKKPRGFLSKSAFGQEAMLTIDQVFLVKMHFAQPFWSTCGNAQISLQILGYGIQPHINREKCKYRKYVS